tara:strand:+ start:922 stop:1182 length:261 start_codon:yes stop_codon:yes gene_type:complete
LNIISSYAIKISVIVTIVSVVSVVSIVRKITSIEIWIVKTIGIGSIVGIVKPPTVGIVSSSKTTVKTASKVSITKTKAVVEIRIVA